MKRFASTLALAVAFSMAFTPSAAQAEDSSFADVAALTAEAAHAKRARELREEFCRAVAEQISALAEQMSSAGYDSLEVQRVTSSLDAFMRAKEGRRPIDAKKWTDAVRLQLGLRIEPLEDLSHIDPWATEVWEKDRRFYRLSSLPYYREYLSVVILPQMTTEKGDAQ